MKTFRDLTPAQQTKAVEQLFNQIITDSLEVGFLPEELDEYHDFLRDSINEGEAKNTPWFIPEIFVGKVEANQDLKNSIMKMATSLAKKAFYPDPQDLIVRI